MLTWMVPLKPVLDSDLSSIYRTCKDFISNISQSLKDKEKGNLGMAGASEDKLFCLNGLCFV